MTAFCAVSLRWIANLEATLGKNGSLQCSDSRMRGAEAKSLLSSYKSSRTLRATRKHSKA